MEEIGCWGSGETVCGGRGGYGTPLLVRGYKISDVSRLIYLSAFKFRGVGCQALEDQPNRPLLVRFHVGREACIDLYRLLFGCYLLRRVCRYCDILPYKMCLMRARLGPAGMHSILAKGAAI